MLVWTAGACAAAPLRTAPAASETPELLLSLTFGAGRPPRGSRGPPVLGVPEVLRVPEVLVALGRVSWRGAGAGSLRETLPAGRCRPKEPQPDATIRFPRGSWPRTRCEARGLLD